MDLTPTEVLLAERVGMVLVEGLDIVGLVGKCHFPCQLMAHRSNEDAIEAVIVRIKANLGAIFEFDQFVPMALDSARFYTEVDLIL